MHSIAGAEALSELYVLCHRLYKMRGTSSNVAEFEVLNIPHIQEQAAHPLYLPAHELS